MRVAFTGSHRTGKTTLLEAVAEQLPGYATFEEPYRVLEDDGVELSDPPAREDFERQLRCSLDILADDSSDALFDRSPIDFIAYLHAIGEQPDEIDDALRLAMESLDLLVFVPIEEPDRIAVPSFEDRRLRAAVDDVLHHLLVDDSLAFGVRVLEVHGPLAARLGQVLRALD